MTPDLQKEFRLLSEQAQERLKSVAASGSYRRVFSLWIRPSFAPSSRCTVYSPRPRTKGELPFAEFSIWRSDLDSEKLRTPVERLKYPRDLAPTIESDVLWLADREVEQIEQRIRGISVPLYLGRCTAAGLDGTSFEFHYDELLYSISLRWWSNHPIEWRPFTETIIQIREELEQRRKEKTQSEDVRNDGSGAKA